MDNDIKMYHGIIMMGKTELSAINQAIYNFIGTGKFSTDIRMQMNLPIGIRYTKENLNYINEQIITIIRNYIYNGEIIINKTFREIHIGNAPFENCCIFTND